MKYRCVVPARQDRGENSFLCGRGYSCWDRSRDFTGGLAFCALGINGRDIVRIRLACLHGSIGILSAGNDSICQPDGAAGSGRAIDVVTRNWGGAGDPGDRYGVRVDRFRRPLGVPAKPLSTRGHER
jgi:hypothetical protein